METNKLPTDVARAAIDAARTVVGDRAFLHDDPAAYRAGARDALDAVTRANQPADDDQQQ